ncbi:MAG: hypothetical protein NTU47_07545 [Ignavibacteriales bacterium]|nr:hypothetical protein [Ignavibacteriales bacterium]
MDVRKNSGSAPGGRKKSPSLLRGFVRLAAASALFLSVLQTAAAQEPLRFSLPRQQDSLRISSLSFDRVLNTYTWNGSLFFDREFSGVDVKFRQLLRSRLIRTDQQSDQNEYGDSLIVGTEIAEGWKLRAQQVSSVLSDNRAIDLTRLGQHQFLAGMRVTPSSGVSFGALAGYEIDAQQDELDRGFSYQANAEAEGIRFEEFHGSFKGRWAQSLLTRRRPASASIDVSLVRDFGAEGRNLILFTYDHLRREFYTSADLDVRRVYQTSDNIFRRDAASYEVSDQLEYHASDRMQLVFRGGMLTRIIDRGLQYKVMAGNSNPLLDTRIQETQLYGEAGTSYQPVYWLGLDVNLAYREREERHQVTESGDVPISLFERQQRSERRLENIARRTSLSSQVRTLLSESDQLNFAGSASILRYDTPDSTNVDERDELLVSIGLQEIHQFSSALSLSLVADVSLSHLVYLKSVQSANNNWNRVLRFSPTVVYAPAEGFRTVNQAEVLGNYTVYDFEDQGALTRSFSFRQASWLDSTTFRLSQLLSAAFVGEVRVYERGILMWSEFKERPQDYFVERTYWPRVTYAAAGGLSLGVGFRYFSQDRYKYQTGTRIFLHQLESSGPTVALTWEGTGFQRLVFEGWNETQWQDGQLVRTIPNLLLKLNYSL